MRQTVENRINKNEAKAPQPPTKPKFRSIHRVAKNDYSIPWVVFNGVGELTESNILDERNFVVELAPLRYKDRLRFERENPESIDELITKIVWVLDRMYQVLSDKTTDADREEISKQLTRNDLGQYETPMGPMWGSLDLNVANLCTFILAARGRIVGKTAEGYKLEAIEPDDILNVLEGNPFLELNENMLPVVIEILDAAGLYNVEELENRESAEAKTEELAEKKGASPKKKGAPPTAKSSKRGSSTSTELAKPL